VAGLQDSGSFEDRKVNALQRPGNRRQPDSSSERPIHLVAGSKTLRQATEELDLVAAGEWMHRFITELYPICRSITGAGLRRTLARIREQVPLTVHEIPSGTRIFDWTVPKEWNIRNAWVKNARGEKVIDFEESNLHVVNYSIPVRRRMSAAELRNHCHSLPDRPDCIPYRTTYYKEDWGFCLSHRELSKLEDGEYEVCIDSALQDGSLSIGEYYIPGKRDEEILLSCHACHPSLCNDNLSGIALVTRLAELLSSASLEYSYRFLFIPGTIGSIAWLAQNEAKAPSIRHGLVTACVGDPGRFHYKRSRRGNAEIDRAVIHCLRHCGQVFELLDFTPYGYDERQYCSPGFNLAVGSLTRTPHGRFVEYHTSADDLTFVRAEALAGSLQLYLAVIGLLENNARYLSLNPKCEPQLGKRGLYRELGGMADAGQFELAMLWVLNLSDGTNSILDIAERSGLKFDSLHAAAAKLTEAKLLERLEDSPGGYGMGD
jgi:aminopeptidase-like protein